MVTTKRPKFVLITGCSQGGIGHALAREFQSKGLQVIATARSKDKIADLGPRGITLLSLDVDDPASIARLKNDVERITDGQLDVLVNNAGRNYTVPALDVDFGEVEQTFRTNVFGVMRMCQAFAPLLIAARGTIVQVGSIAGLMPYPFGSVYNASKAALHQYSDTLRVELAPFGVKVVTLVTGGIKSNIARTDRTLPEDSYYIPITTEYARRVKHSQESGFPSELYAKQVVPKVLGSKPRKVWAGHAAWYIWFATTFLPVSLLEYVFSRMFNLWKLRQASTSEKKLK